MLGVPFFYLLTALLNRILTPLIRLVWRKIHHGNRICSIATSCPDRSGC